MCVCLHTVCIIYIIKFINFGLANKLMTFWFHHLTKHGINAIFLVYLVYHSKFWYNSIFSEAQEPAKWVCDYRCQNSDNFWEVGDRYLSEMGRRNFEVLEMLISWVAVTQVDSNGKFYRAVAMSCVLFSMCWILKKSLKICTLLKFFQSVHAWPETHVPASGKSLICLPSSLY